MQLVVLHIILILFVKRTDGITCPKGITAFATNYGNSSYFKCVDGEAVLSDCDSGFKYDRYLGECIKEEHSKRRKRSVREHEPIDALGQPISLGTLYDARRNMIWNGAMLWSRDALKNTEKVDHGFSESKFFVERSFFDRAALFNLDAELELAFLSGLVTVKGSAGYLRDSKETNEKVRVVMEYLANTHTETVPWSLPVTYPDLCSGIESDDGPTHVISSVTYGVRAVFLFEKTASSSSSVEEVRGSLEIAVKSIPSFQISGKAAVDIKGKKVENDELTNVRFYGDVILDKNPSTYVDAIKVFDGLPAKARNAKSALSFKLTSIKRYCSVSEVVILSINKNMVQQTTAILEHFSGIQREVNSLSNTVVAQKFYSIRKTLITFTSGMREFSNRFKSELVEKLPALKAGKIGESDLVSLIAGYDKSPYQYEKAINFLQLREREINTIQLVISEAIGNKKISITDASTANDNTCIFKKVFTTVYVMHVLPKEDVAEKYIKGKDEDSGKKKWFNDNNMVGQAGQSFKKFVNYAELNHGDGHCFLIQLKHLNEKPDVVFSVLAIKNGKEISDDFLIPDAPPTPDCRIEFNVIDLILPMTKNKFIEEYLVEYEGLGSDDKFEGITSKLEPFRKFIKLVDLKPATLYKIQVAYKTINGRSMFSKMVHCKTLPSSPPSGLRVTLATHHSLTVKWNTPEVIAPDIPHSYVVKTKQMIGKSVESLADISTSAVEVTIDNLRPSSRYEVRVFFKYGDFSSPETSVVYGTTPSALPDPVVVNVTQHSAEITANVEKVQVADGTKMIQLVLEYSKMDDKGNNAIPGTTLTKTHVFNDIVTISNKKTPKKKSKKKKTTITNTNFLVKLNLDDLAASTTYSIKFFILIFNLDNKNCKSDFSNTVIFRTSYMKTELQKLKDMLDINVEDVKIELQSYKSKQNDTLLDMQSELQYITSEFQSYVTQQEEKHKRCIQYLKSTKWKPAIKNVMIDFNIEDQVLQLKTDGRPINTTNSGELVLIYLFNDKGRYRSQISWNITPKSASNYVIRYCTPDPFNPGPKLFQMVNVPAEEDKIWTILKSNRNIIIKCNGIEVVNLVYADVDKTLFPYCTNRLSKTLMKIEFGITDDTDMYRQALADFTTTGWNSNQTDEDDISVNQMEYCMSLF